MGRPHQTAESFWAKVDIKAPSECWPWTGSKVTKGYGGVKYQGESRRAHRLAAYLHGIIPTLEDERLILHACDNPPCCNPAHLRAGTHKENAKDRDERRRNTYPTGESHPKAKLTADDVNEIRRRYAAGEATQTALGLEFGVCYSTISAIVKNKLWKTLA